MTTTVLVHFMPWEIDYALLSFSQLNRSKYYLPHNSNVKIRSMLNLSSHVIDWERSKIPREYFIEKYQTLGKLLDKYDYVGDIYEGSELYGHLDFQRQVYQEPADYYLGLCPDVYFSEHLLAYMVQAAQQVQNDCFYITPQICTLWDTSWDVITNRNIGVLDHKQWIERDVFDIDYYTHTANEPVQLQELHTHKWAGWFDLCNRKFVEELGEIPQDWSGYGSWDLYTMNVCNAAKQMGYDFQQYILTGQIVFPYSHGVKPFTPPSDGMVGYYKSNLQRKETNQRINFNSKIEEYIFNKVNKLVRK